jgi:hypothetical protein
MTAHRASWIIHNGKIPNGLFVCHKCDNKKCVNPDHLFLGTQKDNMKDKISKGREARGKSHGSFTRPEKTLKGESVHLSKLKNNDILNIRKLRDDGEKLLDIANIYGVTMSNISCICKNKTWKHIKKEATYKRP